MNKHERKGGAHQPGSLDGFISGSRGLGVPAHRSYQPNRGPATPSLGDDLKLADGFHPARQSSGQPLGSPAISLERLDEPIILDEPDATLDKKRRRLRNRQIKHASRKRKYLKRAAMLAGILLVAGLGALGYKFYDAQKQILAGGGQALAVCDPDIPPERLEKEGDSRINIMIVGIGGKQQPRGPNLTDTLIVASIDPVNNKADLLSIPRDLFVQIPGNGSTKVNEAYVYGFDATESGDRTQKQKAGLDLLERTLDEVLDIDIHYHVLVDYAAFRQGVDAVGGLDVYVPENLAVTERLWDDGTGQHYLLDVGEGQQHFDGTRALFFSRSRYTSARSDFDRSERQRLMLTALKDKVLSAGTFANPVKVTQLLDSLGGNVYTDFNTESIKCLYDRLSQIEGGNIKSLDMASKENNLLATGNFGGRSIVRPSAGLYAYDDIQDFVHRSMADGFIIRENTPVHIYNATSQGGVATAQAGILKSYGYNVQTVDSTPTATNPATTVVVDLTGGTSPYTRNYLQKRYNTAAVNSLPPGSGITPPAGSSFVIILGRDVNSSAN